MLLDVWSVLGGIGLAAVAFIVVILVCVVILRLLAAILPSYEDREAPAVGAGEGVPEELAAPAGEAPVPGADAKASSPGADEAAPGSERDQEVPD
jgi:hypothetical protein